MSQGGHYFLLSVSSSLKLEALPSAPPLRPSISLCQLSNFPFVAAVGNFKF